MKNSKKDNITEIYENRTEDESMNKSMMVNDDSNILAESEYDQEDEFLPKLNDEGDY